MKTTLNSNVRRHLAKALVLATLASGIGGFAFSASAGAGSDTLRPGETLGPGQELRSSNGYQFVMQADGNAVIYKPTSSGRTPIWASNTVGAPGAYIAMQTDGNLVIYRPNGGIVYGNRIPTNTTGSGAYLVMQSDGNAVVYRPTTGGRVATWASNSAQSSSPGTPNAPTAPGRKCSPYLYLTLSKASGNPADLRLKVNATRADCRVIGANFAAASGKSTNQCTKNVGWLPSGKYLVGAYYQNGRGTLVGRSHFDIAPAAGTSMCGRGGFAIHSDSRVTVPSSSTTFTKSSEGCIKISGRDLTTLKSIYDGYKADGGQSIGLMVS